MQENNKKNIDGIKAIIYNVKFSKSSLYNPVKISEELKTYISSIATRINNEALNLHKNGFVFIYGDPRITSLISNKLNNETLDFKYWIAINSNEINNDIIGLQPNHIGLSFYSNKKSKIFDIDKEAVRTVRFSCPACGKNSKDWGGKKHLMNKKGVALSDVWNDFIEIQEQYEDPEIQGVILNVSNNHSSLIINGDSIPELVLDRIIKLSKSEQNYKVVDIDRFNHEDYNHTEVDAKLNIKPFDKMNMIELADSIVVMEELVKNYPDGLFDLIFADPPYNLNKNYDNYDDDASDKEYMEWTKHWLDLSYKLLKPNGNMFYLNIPKWNIKTIDFLPVGSYYKDAIVWDAMSTPMGKIMPAHYSLIHITKSLNSFIDSTKIEKSYPAVNYCLRASCIKNRKSEAIVPLSNIWSDVHRIKHRRDRDYHPCQLPDSLLSRIITIFSKPKDLVFDPFNGVGTTAVWSKMLNRNYYSIDLSHEYVEITKAKLSEVSEYGEVQKLSIKRPKSKITKKAIEVYAQNLILKNNELKNEEEFISFFENNKTEFTIEDIINKYGEVKLLLKKI